MPVADGGSPGWSGLGHQVDTTKPRSLEGTLTLSPHKQLYLGYLKSLGPALLFEFFHALYMDSQEVFRDHVCF